MSRIGRLPITVPSNVDVTIDGRQLTVAGPRGSLSRELHPDMTVSREDDKLVVTRPTEQKTHKQLHGLTRTLVSNMVIGVTDGYRKGLEITGVGYRAAKVGEKLQLNLGYSHPIEIDPPSGISFELESPTRLAVFRSLNHIYAQIIDDASGQTLAAASTVERELKGSTTTKTEEAAAVGRLVAERARTAGVERVVFDRAGFRYHGRIKSLADAAREAGLDF